MNKLEKIFFDPQPDAICINCGKLFEKAGGYSNTMYCSMSCKKKAYWKRKSSKTEPKTNKKETLHNILSEKK